jgi:hypothetical protein
MTTWLEVREVEKVFGGAPVLRGVSFEVGDGEIMALLGPSGCGKSTLLRIIAGLESADRGSVSLAGRDLAGTPVHERGFGLMFQDWALFPHRTVAENIAFGLRMQRRPRAEVAARVDEMLGTIGLAGYGGRGVCDPRSGRGLGRRRSAGAAAGRRGGPDRQPAAALRAAGLGLCGPVPRPEQPAGGRCCWRGRRRTVGGNQPRAAAGGAPNQFAGTIERATFRGGNVRALWRHTSGTLLEVDLGSDLGADVGCVVTLALEPSSLSLIADRSGWLEPTSPGL